MRTWLLLIVAVLVTGCPKRVAEAPPADAGTQASAIENSPPPPAIEPIDAGAPATEAPAPVPPPTSETGPGDSCTSDAQCPDGTVCEGCSDTDRRCIPGCRTDKDCNAPEKCQRVECIRCPCPPLCGI